MSWCVAAGEIADAPVSECVSCNCLHTCDQAAVRTSNLGLAPLEATFDPGSVEAIDRYFPVCHTNLAPMPLLLIAERFPDGPRTNRAGRYPIRPLPAFATRIRLPALWLHRDGNEHVGIATLRG